LANQSGEQSSCVQFEQRSLKHAGRRLGSERFARARNADDQQPLGRRQAISPRLVTEGITTFEQPFLEHFRTANVVVNLRAKPARDLRVRIGHF
jgi:hypothetical protein